MWIVDLSPVHTGDKVEGRSTFGRQSRPYRQQSTLSLICRQCVPGFMHISD